MIDEREARLPAWCRELLANLRQRIQVSNEPLVKELALLRPKVELLQARNNAMEELLLCAANGGHMTARAIMDVIEGYDLVLKDR